MALTIEDGTLVDGADSYATVAEARAFATARGVTLSSTDSDVEVLLRKAADYIDALESRFKGDRVASDQALAWPRTEVYLFEDEEAQDEDAIPSLVIKAQCQLAMDAVDVDLLPTGAGREVIRQKTDVIETEYAKQGTGTIRPELNKAFAILEPLFAGSGGMTVQTIRV